MLRKFIDINYATFWVNMDRVRTASLNRSIAGGDWIVSFHLDNGQTVEAWAGTQARSDNGALERFLRYVETGAPGDDASP